MNNKKNLKIIFFGEKNNLNSIKAVNFLKKKFKKVITILEENKIGTKFNGSKYNNFDIILTYRTKIILPKTFIKKARLFAINFHNSLPKYPGSGGLSWSIVNEDIEAGITAHFLNEKIDNGKIIYIKKFKISKNIDINKLTLKSEKKHLQTFYYVMENIFIEKWINTNIKKFSSYFWNGKAKKISLLNKKRIISIKIKKKSLENIIRATCYKKYKPYIKLFGYKFELKC